MQDINSIISILKAEIDEYIYNNNNQAITGLILNSVLNDIVEQLAVFTEYMTLDLAVVDEDGLYFTDGEGNIFLSITNDGLNVAYFESSLIDYINSIIEMPEQTEFVSVNENGLFIIDNEKNILASFTNDGFDAALISQHFIDYLNSVVNSNTTWTKINNTQYIITL